jgi:hypothetical protein
MKQGPLIISSSGLFVTVCVSLLVICILLTSSNSRSSRGVPNIFSNAPKENFTSATLSSALSSSIFMSIASLLAFFLLRTQFLREKKAMREIHTKMFELGALIQTIQKKQLTYVKYGKKEQTKILEKQEQLLQQNKKLVSDAWPEDLLLWETISQFTMMGEVLSGDMSLDEALKACNDNNFEQGYAVQVCFNTKTKRAVVKGVGIPAEAFFGTSDVETVKSRTFKDVSMRCGEGYHPNYDTHIHPRFFILNEIVIGGETMGKVGQTGAWQPVSADTIRQAAKADQDLKNYLNEGCMLGNSGTCKWNTWGKLLLFNMLDVIFSLAFFVTGPVGVALTAVELGVVSIDLAIDLKIQPDKLKKYANSVSNYLQRFPNNTLICNRNLGTPNYFATAERAVRSIGCAKKNGPLCRWGCNSPNAFPEHQEKIRQMSALSDELEKACRTFEDKPIDKWNIDEITEICDVNTYVRTQTPKVNCDA